MLEIDQTKLPESLFVINEDGTKTIDYSKIKSIQDVDNLERAKQHVKNELKALKDKYAGIDLNKYSELINAELQANKDILTNPVYKNLQTKYNALNQQLENLKGQLLKRDKDIQINELKDNIRNFKGIQPGAVEDILYRLQSNGFSKTEKGFLNNNGQNIETYLENLKKTSPHLFKRTIGLENDLRAQNLQTAFKSNNLMDALKNCPRTSKH